MSIINPLLEVKEVTKHFGTATALHNVSLQVPKGSIFGLLGPNGAGKTTLLRIINQIAIPDAGSVYFDGNLLDTTHTSAIGYMPEERGLYKSMRVGEQLLYLAQLKGMSKKDATERIQYWFDKFDISDWWNKKIQELSKGMAQKIQFIVTVLHRPKLLIFDEPFSGFDPINAGIIKDEILQLRDEGATIVFSTHRMENVEELCDHIALMYRSQKILDGTVSEIKKTYRSHTFEVGLQTTNQEHLMSVLQEQYTTKPAYFKTIDDQLKLQITVAPETASNALLTLLNTQSTVLHFKEMIPSVHDIFIQKIKENE